MRRERPATMTTEIPSDAELDRMEAAADWLIWLQDAGDDEAAIAAWLKWCDADAQNLAAFRRAQVIWHAAEPGQVHAGLTSPAAATVDRNPRHPVGWRTYVPIAASALLIAAIGGAVWKTTLRGTDGTPESFATPVATVSTSVLPDGSTVDLGARSRVTTHYSASVRGVTVESGEAFFTVTKDVRRPFVVSAGGVQVTAIGTAFNVQHSEDRVVVAVREGTVHLTSAADNGTSPDLNSGHLVLDAGQEAIVTPNKHRIAVRPINRGDAASWRDGVLKYENEPLAAVAADLNRYSRRRIVVNDPALRDLPFTGTVFIGSVDEALVAFAKVFPLAMVQHDEQIDLVPRR
jgi:transmembrane sensor